MPSCTHLRRLIVGSWLLLLPLHAASADLPATATEAEVREWIQRLDQKDDQAARLQALQWLYKHAAGKNATLAIPVLQRTLRDDPASQIRQKAVLALYQIAKEQKLPCPVALVESIHDQDVSVRQDAGSLAVLCKSFAPGTVEVALRGCWSEETDIRNYGLEILSLAAPRDPKALAVLETAKNDSSYQIRHNVRCYKFNADDRLDEYLAWLIRVQEDEGVLNPIPKDEALRQQEACLRNLGIIGGAQLVIGWSDKRPEDLAAALVQLMNHQSAVVRRGGVRLAGVAAAKSEPIKCEAGDDPLSEANSYLFPKFESGATKPGTHPKPRPVKSKAAPCLEKRGVRKRLQDLSEDDPDRAVRRAARSALNRLARLDMKP